MSGTKYKAVAPSIKQWHQVWMGLGVTEDDPEEFPTPEID